MRHRVFVADQSVLIRGAYANYGHRAQLIFGLVLFLDLALYRYYYYLAQNRRRRCIPYEVICQ